MPGIPDPADPLWDEFFSFLERGDTPATGAEADAELRRLGVDLGAAQKRVLNAAKRARAKAELAAAKARAEGVQSRMNTIPASPVTMSRDRIKLLIAARCDEPAQRAYFRKLDESSSDDDLRAILADLDCLKLIAEDHADGGEPC